MITCIHQVQKSGILYGLGKIHKALEDRIPTSRPILSAIGTPTYKLANFCDKLLKPITTNEYTINDSFSFAKEVEEFDSNLIMASFDVKSLFTSIPLTETVRNCYQKNFLIDYQYMFGFYKDSRHKVENLYRNQTYIDNLSKSSFRRILEMTMYESFFIFHQEYFKQRDGVAMGFPLGPILGNVFMCHFENIWLENCPTQFKPVLYRICVDNTFLLFRSKEHVEKLKKYLKRQHKNIAFTLEWNKMINYHF